MKWSVFIIVAAGIVLVVIGWRGTHNNLWQSLGGTVNTTTPPVLSIFPNESTTFTPAQSPTIPSILTNNVLLQSVASGNSAGNSQGSPVNMNEVSSQILQNYLQSLHQ